MALVPDSLPDSQCYADYGLEATQLSQPRFSQPASQGFFNSQVEPRRKYWAILIPTNSSHAILKLPWSKPRLQIGRGTHSGVGNDVVLAEKRVSNRHCRISIGVSKPGEPAMSSARSALIQALKDGDGEPEVWIEDLRSSNGTFINGQRITTRRLLQHGDEISLGHVGTADNHEVRFIFRSVGDKGQRHGAEDRVGEVYQRYQMLSTLGKGTFAEVKQAVDVETGDLRAIKQIVKHRFGHNPKTLELFQREIDICTRLTHENICRLIEWYEDPQHICLVLEYVDGGDLLDYIMKWPADGLPEDEAADLTFQICRAMAYCHENGVTHRDLKPENILLTKETPLQGSVIKIADFGLAKMVHSDTMLVSMVGTPQYLAPEVVMQTRQKPGYENVVDSWSVGIIVYSMLTKALPFDDNADLTMEQRIRSRYEMDFDRETLTDREVSDLAVDFISRCLERDPAKRMTLTDALNHEWLSGPSSLPNEEPSQGLGGDSMWNIQSFDSTSPWVEGADRRSPTGGMELDDERATPQPNSRLTTESANFDTSATNLDGSNMSSDESFSQPMENLRLNTMVKGLAPGALSPAREEDEPMSVSVNGVGPAKPNGVHPPSSVIMETAPPPATSVMDVDNSVFSKPPKRKLSSDPFGSGSLSPPPPAARARDRDVTPKPEPQRLTRAATARAAASVSPQTRARTKAAPDAPAPAPPPASAQAPRPRKSKRIG